MKFINFILLTAVVMLNTQAHAAFTQSARRYMSPRDLFNVMAQKFPIISERKKMADNAIEISCYAIVASNVNVIGVVSPAIGRPAVELPPPGFVRWLGSCGHKIILAQIDDLYKQPKNERLWARYIPADFLAKYRDPANAAKPYHALETLKWSEIDPALQASLLKFTVSEFIGPEAVIRDLGYAKTLKEVTDSIEKTVTGDDIFPSALHNILLATMLREEFLSY